MVEQKRKRSERKVQYEKNVGVMCLGWKDKHDVYMMSTCIADNISNVKRKGKVEQVPEIIETYNSKIGGVDKSYQMLTSYKLERKRLKK